MNTIREGLAAEVRALLPLLHATYRLIGRYQKNRNERNARALEAQLVTASELLHFFRPHVPRPKRPYFDAIANAGLSLSDRVIALDTAVAAMHTQFSPERAYRHRESAALRRALELSRVVAGEAAPAVPHGEDVLARGIPASPGVVTGKAALIRRHSDYRRLPAGSVVVARMTSPEVMVAVGRVVALVTDVGGSLCHAAVVARELGIPCVVGTGDATQRIRPPRLVCVNGTEGTVRKIGRGPG